jgi:hypothetical protein
MHILAWQKASKCVKISLSFTGKFQGALVQYPLSRDEHAAMARYVSGIRRQLQDVSDLFAARYGKDSSIAEIAVKTLVSSTLLEHELALLEAEPEFAAVEAEKASAAF